MKLLVLRRCTWSVIVIAGLCIPVAIYILSTASGTVRRSNFIYGNSGIRDIEIPDKGKTNSYRDDKPADSAIISEQVDPYTERRKRIADVCHQNPRLSTNHMNKDQILDSVRIIPRHRLIMCLIEKAASTYLIGIGQTMAKTPGRFENTTHAGAWEGKLTKPQEVPFVDNFWLLSDAFKVMFVRNPYTRLLSGYEDKILIPNFLFQNFGKETITFSRVNASQKALACGLDATFPEYVRYVNELVITEIKRNMIRRHFMPMFDHCGLCEVHYDFIGKLETIVNDTRVLLRHLDVEKIMPKKPLYVSEIQDHVGWMYSFKDNIKVNTCMSFTDIKHRYWKKFQIKGIIHRKLEMPDNILHNDSITKKEMMNFMLKMAKKSIEMGDLKMNRILALREAFQTLPVEELRQFRKLFQPDFELFGYDIDDADIFAKPWDKRNGAFFDVPLLKGELPTIKPPSRPVTQTRVIKHLQLPNNRTGRLKL